MRGSSPTGISSTSATPAASIFPTVSESGFTTQTVEPSGLTAMGLLEVGSPTSLHQGPAHRGPS